MNHRITAAIAALLVLITLVVGLVAAPTSNARPDFNKLRTYYSDAARTNEVGQKYVLCCLPGVCGWVWGTTGPYYSDENEYCD